MTAHPDDETTEPFPFHLCQPDPRKSCAACCGIYNFTENDRMSVSRRLRRNTQLVPCPSCDEKIMALRPVLEATTAQELPRCQTIHNCPFVGFLDKDENTVGCLLHPKVQQGRDLRDHSFYGPDLCADHFCLSYFYLTRSEQRFVIDTIDDWYLYGLIITDIDLVKGSYEILSNRLGEALNPAVFRFTPFRERTQSFLYLKTRWPWTCSDSNHFGKYRLNAHDYQEISINYGALHRRRSPYHRLLIALGSVFQSGSELDEAERLLSRHLDGIVEIYGSLRQTMLSAKIP